MFSTWNLDLNLKVVPVPVTSVANGAIAWELLEDVNSSFDLVLTDVVMPCLSGVGLLSKMMTRELRKRIPVVSKLLILVPMNAICVLTHNNLEFLREIEFVRTC